MGDNWVSRSIKESIKEQKCKTLAQEGKDKRFGQVIGFYEESISYVGQNQERLSKEYGNDYLIVEKNKVIGSGKKLQKLVDSLGSQVHLRIGARGIVIGRIEGIVRYDPSQAVKSAYNPIFILRDLERYFKKDSRCCTCSHHYNK